MSVNIFDILSPGDRVDLQSVSRSLNEDNDDKKFYISKVYDIDEDGDIDIVMPMEKLKVILLSIDEEFDLYFYAKKGIYKCRATVIERYKDEQNFIATFEPDTELEKQQRREYYRYDCVIGMNTRLLSDGEAEQFNEMKDTMLLREPQDKSVIVDISGGGLRFVSAEHYETGKLVLCKYMLSVRGESKIYSSVVRLIASYPVVNNPKNTEYRGQFVYIDDKEREEIIKYIFEEERRMRKRR